MTFVTQYMLFVRQVFDWRAIPLLGFAVLSTMFLVYSGIDWQYFLLTQMYTPKTLLYVADGLGFVLPVLVVTTFMLLGAWLQQPIYRVATAASMYAIILGLTLSTFTKIFTGRTSPPHQHGPADTLVLVDNSHHFQFGFMREQIFGGWPSSHATVSFALATTLFILLPRRWYLTVVLFGCALGISIGVTFGWHWLSEFIAGSALGIVIGIVVGKHFAASLTR